MRSRWKFGVILGVVMGMPLIVEIAPWDWAHTPVSLSATPSPPMLPQAAPGPPAGGAGQTWLAGILLLVGLTMIMVAAAKIVDLRGKRETEMLLLQGGSPRPSCATGR
jgi:hypothetical protein